MTLILIAATALLLLAGLPVVAIALAPKVTIEHAETARTSEEVRAMVSRAVEQARESEAA